MKAAAVVGLIGIVLGLFAGGALFSNTASAQETSLLPVDKAVSVQMRCDIQGFSTDGMPPSVYSPKDETYQIRGTLEATYQDWIILKVSDARKHWIRNESILMITVDTEPRAEAGG